MEPKESLIDSNAWEEIIQKVKRGGYDKDFKQITEDED